jgi:hypothetical protein
MAPTKPRRSRSEAAELARAQTILAALPPLLAGIAAKDAHAAAVRIDRAWVTYYAGVLASAEAAAGKRVVARSELKRATLAERASAAELASLLTDVRATVATHHPDDVNTQRAFGRGVRIEATRTGETTALAGTVLAAWGRQWKQAGLAAGVTQATIDRIAALRDSLTSADVEQHQVMTANALATSDRLATFAALRTMSTFAARVTANVFGRGSRELRSLSDPRPLTSRGAARKAAAKAKRLAAKAAKKAAKAAKPKHRAATMKRRAKRAAVAARTAEVIAAAAKGARTKKKARA